MKTIPFEKKYFLDFVEHISQGKPVIFPTDTSYGFSGDPFQQRVVERVEYIKGREKKPFLLLVSDVAMMQKYGEISHVSAEHFLDAKNTPTTFLLPKSNVFDHQNFFKNFPNIGLRVPLLSLLKDFLRTYKAPIFSTSANISGEDALFTASGVVQKFGNIPDLLFADFGDLPISPPSKIITFQNGIPEYIR